MRFYRRFLPDIMYNMRELGLYPTNDGRLTRPGRFIRSDLPRALDRAHVDLLYDYGVRTVFDLRTESESAAIPCVLDGIDGITYLNISFTDDFSTFGQLEYCPLLHLVPIINGQNKAGEILSAMAEADEGAILFHCHAGKDRTGMVAVLLLLLAGVIREDIIADYQVTYTYIKPALNSIKSSELRPDNLLRTDPEWIEPFLDHIAACGGAEAFLRLLGVSDANIGRLKARLLD